MKHVLSQQQQKKKGNWITWLTNGDEIRKEKPILFMFSINVHDQVKKAQPRSQVGV
jgi:hypothetical protein